jgi:cysteine-rich repeat protein
MAAGRAIVRRWIGVCAGGVLITAAACNQIAAIDGGLPLEGGGGSAECVTVADCAVAVPECRSAVACEQGACLFEDAIEGTPLPAQTVGDCVDVVCDGEGASRVIPVATDAPDDGKACTADTCSGETPVHTPLSEIPCYTGPFGTKGKGICAAGVRQCEGAGDPAVACEGEVLPAAEACEPAKLDEDCDGYVNEEGDGCVCGDGDLSTDEECDDGGAADGDGCSAACVIERAAPVGGGYHTCAILYNGAAKCWGNNDFGQLGLGDTLERGDAPSEMGSNLVVINLGLGATVAAIAGGDRHTCAVLTGGSVKCWGRNASGQLGLGDVMNRGDAANEMGDTLPVVDLGIGKVATGLAAGYFFTCARFNDGSVKCWGGNASGQLGLGTTLAKGDGMNEMGPSLPAVDLGGLAHASAITAGADHACALLDDGTVKCWGHNGSGQLGLGDVSSRADEPNEMGELLPPVDLGAGKKAKAIAAGYVHTCALLEDGAVKCWGGNDDGQLGQGDTLGRGDEPSEMGSNLFAVDLGAGKTAIAIAAGGRHTCALLQGGEVKCWGRNATGQLGLGDAMNRGDEPGEMGDSLPAINFGGASKAAAITAGGSHTCVQVDYGAVKCWGYNEYGQLGVGDVLDRGADPLDMGNNAAPAKLFSADW